MKMKFSVGIVLGLLLVGMVDVAKALPITWAANGHQYEVILDPGTTWLGARADAQAIGSGWDLATITSLAEQLFIVSLLPAPVPNRLEEYYIGGQKVEGNWTWVTGEPFSFSYWGSNEPNNPLTERILALDSRYQVPNWGWNNYTGAGASFVKGYVVEGVPEPSTLLLLGSGLLGLAGLGRRRRA